jgi:hypothetical protein
MAKLRFTDKHRFQNGAYVPAKQSEEPGYLKARFDAIRARQQADVEEAKAKTLPMKRAVK